MKKLSADEKRELFKAMSKEGYPKEAINKIFSEADVSVLRGLLFNVRSGLPVSEKPDMTPLSPGQLQKVKVGAKREAESFLEAQEGKAKAASSGKNTVLYSFKIGVSDLDRLKQISEAEGESVSVLLRQAVRSFLVVKGRR